MFTVKCPTAQSVGIKLAPNNAKRPPPVSSSVCVSTAPRKFRSLRVHHREIKALPFRGEPRFDGFGNLSSLVSENLNNGIPSIMPTRRSKIRPGNSTVPFVSKNSSSFPKMTCIPKWWWRTLGCLSYIFIPLLTLWRHAIVVYGLHRFLVNMEFLVSPFFDAVELMPGWLEYALFMGIYSYVVRREEWPHFLRFHISMAMLLDTGIDLLATACSWMPNIVYRGNWMAYFWLTLTFLQMCPVLKCMLCAVAGTYPDMPFASDLVYMDLDRKMGREAT